VTLKKYYFDIFLSEKYFEKQPHSQSHFQRSFSENIIFLYIF
jgi:hypothetical protein